MLFNFHLQRNNQFDNDTTVSYFTQDNEYIIGYIGVKGRRELHFYLPSVCVQSNRGFDCNWVCTIFYLFRIFRLHTTTLLSFSQSFFCLALSFQPLTRYLHFANPFPIHGMYIHILSHFFSPLTTPLYRLRIFAYNELGRIWHFISIRTVSPRNKRGWIWSAKFPTYTNELQGGGGQTRIHTFKRINVIYYTAEA